MLPVLIALALTPILQFTEQPLPKEPLRLGSVRDTGGTVRVLPDPRARATVLLFVTVDCPIANRYSPEISRIVADYGAKGVSFLLVYVDPSSTAADIEAHRKRFGLKCPALLDTKHALVKAVGARATPQAAVLDARGVLLYRGRIDDLYTEHGRTKDPPYRKDLRIALAESLAGKSVSVPQTPPVGCSIPGTSG